MQISRQRDPFLNFVLDDKVTAFLVKGNFPTLTDEQALEIAHSLLQSEITIEMKLQVRVRSVQEFSVGAPSLHVWGD